MSNPKEALISTIKEWIEINKHLVELQKSLKEYKTKKKTLTNALIDVMKSNDIDCFDVNNGKIVCKTTKVKSTLNKKSLNMALEEYFKDIPSIDAEEISNYILEKRTVKETSSLVIKENK